MSILKKFCRLLCVASLSIGAFASGAAQAQNECVLSATLSYSGNTWATYRIRTVTPVSAGTFTLSYSAAYPVNDSVLLEIYTDPVFLAPVVQGSNSHQYSFSGGASRTEIDLDFSNSDGGPAPTISNISLTSSTQCSSSPTVTNGNVWISGASGTGGVYKIGDTVTATWNNGPGGDNNSGITAVTFDFSQFGGGNAVTAVNSSNTWSATYTITSGSTDATNRNVLVTANNGSGSTTTADTTNATVDNIAPTVTDANITISGATGAGGAYKIGDTVTATWNNTAGGNNNADTISNVTANFSQFGGGAAVSATNSSGTWTATYTITAGAVSAAYRNISVTATDNAGNTTTTSDTSNATVDTQAPTVSSVSVPSNATYTGGQNLDFTVNMSEAIVVNTGGGTPRIALTIGASTVYASYISGSGSSAIVFRYTIQSGDYDADGVTVGTLSLNGGTMSDSAGNNLSTTLNSVGSTASVLVGSAAPTVTGLSPPNDLTAGGATVVITGTNFTGATGVSFGGTAATNVIVNSATQITATAPAGSLGTVNVTVTTPGGTSSTGAANQFTYQVAFIPNAPTVSSLSPPSGTTNGGTTVTITGIDFTGATAVTFGGTAASSFTVNSSTQITATAPARSAGAVAVAVTTSGGTGTLQNAYTYTSASLTLSPSAGALPAGTVGGLYSVNLSASGGSSSYTYAVTTGSLRRGLP